MNKVKKDDIEFNLKKSNEKLTKYMSEQKSQESTEYNKLLAEKNQLDKHFLKLELNHKNQLKALDDSEKDLQNLEGKMQKCDRFIGSVSQKILFAEKSLKDREVEYKERRVNYEEALRNIQACLRGDSGVEDAEYSLKNQINEAQKNFDRTQVEITQYQKKLDYLEKELEV